jgi:hypothetical protein
MLTDAAKENQVHGARDLMSLDFGGCMTFAVTTTT